MEQTFIIQPRDPILIRDGRPFTGDPGAYARSLEWPLPGTVAGAVRTHIGTRLNFDWSNDGPDRAKEILLRGALPASCPKDGAARVDVPYPLDALITGEKEEEREIAALRPDQNAAKQTDLPDEFLRPLDIEDEKKPAKTDAFWSLDDAVRWLSEKSPSFLPRATMAAPKPETRTHVKINPEHGASETGMLFSAEFRVFPDAAFERIGRDGNAVKHAQQFLLCRADCPETYQPKPDFLTLGGERRVAYIEPAGHLAWPSLEVYDALRDALRGATCLRMQLATPALFKHGWKPAWIDADGVGTPWGLAGVSLKLVGAAVGRPLPVSGWSFDRKAFGPKRGRYAVPAGSVYFFNVIGGSVTEEWANKSFLAPVSDTNGERNDGFGLALWGVW